MDKKELKKYLKSFGDNTNGIMFYLSKNGERIYKKDKKDYDGKYITAQEFIYKINEGDKDLYVLIIKSLNGIKVESLLVGVYDEMPYVSDTVFSPTFAYKRDKEVFVIDMN